MIPDIFTMTPDILAIGESAINSLIHNFGKMCLCVYDSETQTVCNNCIFNPVTKQSTNRYNGTGPKPFAAGTCPVCHGSGFIPGHQNTQAEVQLLIDYDPKISKLIADSTIKVPSNIVKVKGFVADEAAVAQSKFIVLDHLNNKYNGNKFVLWSEVAEPGNIIKSKYFEVYLRRYAN